MKKIVSFLLLSLIIVSVRVSGSTVNLQTAQTIATNFFKVNTGNNTAVTAIFNYSKTEDDGTVDFYVFNISPGNGFVIVSATDNTVPVLAYSMEAPFNTSAITQTGLGNWMKHAADNIHTAVQQNIAPDARITGLWTAYQSGQNPSRSRSTVVTPLVKTTWNQEPYYNQLCPYNNTDRQRCVTGCVATTMAQIMKYWNFPAHGTGSYSYTDAPPSFSNNYGVQSANFDTTTYNWTAMPLSINTNNTAIATLMYHCGVSVAMDYGDDNQDGSGAWVLQSEAGNGQPCSEMAYATYFGYNPNTIQGVRSRDYSASDWIKLIESELNAGRPVQYEGDDRTAGGHTWVCDGYDNNNLLHMNWGWGGSANGYYSADALTAGGYNFSTNDGALIGIQPLFPFSLTSYASNATICNAGSTDISAQGPASATYSWSPATGLGCASCATTTAAPTTTTLYTVTADSGGVKALSSVLVVVATAATVQFNSNVTSSCSVPATFSFNNASTSADSYYWDFGDATTSTQASPSHTYTAYGDYSVMLIATGACGIDSVTKSNLITVSSYSPTSVGATMCEGQATTLTASGTGNISWYLSPSDTTPVARGTTYTTLALNTSQTYYIQAELPGPATTAGPADSSIGSGSYYNHATQHAILFNCAKPQVLKSVDVYAKTAGTRTIFLNDASGNVLASASVNMPAGHSTVNLNFQLPVENNLALAIDSFINLYRSSVGATYPYYSTDSTVVLTNSDAGTPGYFYFFYNWKMQSADCISPLVPVQVNVLNSSTSLFTYNSVDDSVSFNAAGGAVSYFWYFGDGYASNINSPSHIYAPGTYTVTLYIDNDTCADTVRQTIQVGQGSQTGINPVAGKEMMNIYPVPATDELHVDLSANQNAGEWNVIAYDMLGRQVLKSTRQLPEGASTFSLDLRSLTPGVYLLHMQNGSTQYTRRFTRQN